MAVTINHSSYGSDYRSFIDNSEWLYQSGNGYQHSICASLCCNNSVISQATKSMHYLVSHVLYAFQTFHILHCPRLMHFK